jgi:pyruvate dehydrogenase E1 component alpha subunit
MEIPLEILLEGYRRMTRIRLFEERVAELLKRGEIYGGVHTSVGQEASAVGALLAVRSTDYMTGTHRSHGHPIAKGAAVAPLMAEIFARATGVCRGKGGSMHLADFSVGSLGESGIVASSMPIAVGAGLTAKLTKSDAVCVCFFGDGASNEGAFHESLNLASVWKLPVIFLCENNGYAITTPSSASMAINDVAIRASAYGMPGVTVDGQDFCAVYPAVLSAVERARAGGGPSLVETKTYRYVEHSLGLVARYREEAEIATWRSRDPIAMLGTRLVDSCGVSASELASILEEEQERLSVAVEFARASPHPTADEAFQDLYSNPFPIQFDDTVMLGHRNP